MPNVSWGLHNQKRIRETIEHLKEIAAQIEGSALLLEAVAPDRELRLPVETGLVDGLGWLQKWADGLRDEVRRLKSKTAVSESPAPVSGRAPKAVKAKGK